MASTYVLHPLVRLAGVSYNFGAEVGSRSWPEVGEKRISRRELRGRDTNNEREREYEMKVSANVNVNIIIRLVCIDRYSGFKYRRGSESRGGAGMETGVRGEERSYEHEVESTHDTGA